MCVCAHICVCTRACVHACVCVCVCVHICACVCVCICVCVCRDYKPKTSQSHITLGYNQLKHLDFPWKNSQNNVHTAQEEQERLKPTVQELAVEDGHAGNTTDELKVGQVILI